MKLDMDLARVQNMVIQGPVEDVSDSEDFSQMNRGTDVITEMNRGQDRIEEDKETGYSIDRTRGEKGYHKERKGTL